MNNITQQPTGVYKFFVQNPARLNNAPQKPEAIAPVENNSDSKAKRIVLRSLIGVTAAAAVACAIYYKKSSKALKIPDENPIVKAPEEEFRKYLTEYVFTTEHEEHLKQLRSQYQKCTNGIVGKINKALSCVKDFFKKNFYNY